MIVGVLTVTFEISESNSLKDKRQVVKSLIDIIRRRFNISAAEIEDMDLWRRSTLGFACVSNDKAVVNSLLDKVVGYIESNPRVQVTDTQMEFL